MLNSDPERELTIETRTTAQTPQPSESESFATRAARSVHTAANWIFGVLSIVFGLAICSVVPGLNFVSLGYLAAASGRVARSGRFRDGFMGVAKAAVLGRFVIGAWLVLLPVRILSGLWRDAELVHPLSNTARLWHAAVVLAAALACLQIVWACLRGGRIRHFLWPAPLALWRWIRTARQRPQIGNALTNYLIGLRLPFFFWLGLRAFIGSLVWLGIPVGLLILAARFPADQGGGALSLLGGLLLLPVVYYLPFLQVHFAMEQRFSALFEPGRVRRAYKRAPWLLLVALFVTLLFAIPLYLLKVELPPRELSWMPSLIFVVFIWPARLLTGFAFAQASKRQLPRHWILRWTSRIASVPVLVAYVVIVYLTQFLSWKGTLSLLEQHAFLVPAPLLNL